MGCIGFFRARQNRGLEDMIQAIRQMLGNKDLPEYVGEIETEAPYRPE